MKILVIPDVHGNWGPTIKYVQEHKGDVEKVVFLGDYVDDFDERKCGLGMITGMRDMFNMARKEPDKFVILLGNHDLQYLTTERYSGYRGQYRWGYHNALIENIELIDIIKDVDGWIFSHAGVSSSWMERFAISEDLFGELEQKRYGMTQEEWISKCAIERTNTIFHSAFTNEEYRDNLVRLFGFAYDVKDRECDGTSEYAGPLWIRPSSLVNVLKYPQQVIGHTERWEAPIFLNCNGYKLIMLDSPEHNKWFILDTENLPNFVDIKDFMKIRPRL